jgi:hypothetical protein
MYNAFNNIKGGIMKKLLALVLLSVFLMVFCGAPPEEAAKPEPTEGKGIEVAYGALGEPELQKLIRVLPEIEKTIEASGENYKAKEGENLEDVLGSFATANKQIAGLDAKLKAVGMPWNEFWPAFSKTWMAYMALEMEENMGEMEEGLKQIEEQMNNPNIPAEQRESMKKAKESMEQLKTMHSKVPQGNKNLVKKYAKKLEEIMED